MFSRLGLKQGLFSALLAGFGTRALSFLIDVVAPCIVFAAALLAVLGVLGQPLSSHPERAIIIVAEALGLIAFVVWNSGYRQGATGQSIGRRATKTKLVKIEAGEPIGFSMALRRLICFAVALGLCFLVIGIGFLILNYLWPLRDPRRQTGADKIVKAVVGRIDDATT